MPNTSKNKTAINFVLLLARFYIWLCRSKGNIPTIENFKPFLKQYNKELNLSLFSNPITSLGSLAIFTLSFLPDIPFLFSSLQHSKYIKLNFSESAEKISLIFFFSFELELQLTKIYHTSPPPLFSGFCSVCNPYCK